MTVSSAGKGNKMKDKALKTAGQPTRGGHRLVSHVNAERLAMICAVESKQQRNAVDAQMAIT